MDTATVSAVIIGACGALILGMAALIKTMVVGKLDALQAAFDDMRNDHHRLDVRVTKLEAEHTVMHCRRRGGEE